MAIGRETLENIFRLSNLKWKTSITKVEPNRLITKGYPQEELIGNISFSEMVYLLIKGEMPSKKESKMLEAVLVSFCDHGVTPPSTQAARLMASAGSPLNTCVAGGLLAFGKHHAGALERAMRILQEGIHRLEGDFERDIEKIAVEILNDLLQCDAKIPGFGHRYHTEDPRAPRLIELARKYDCSSIHTELTLTLENLLFENKGIRMNIDGANAGILSDMGFDWRVGSGIFMIGRLPAIIAHVTEEKTREPPFRKLFKIDEIFYDGVDERKVIK
ncbi:MAG: citryl-CoA lyase [Euryarchaeota archaeon]|nr:citryl-CoA lyase [Euryarchaeota archaeon]